MKIFRALGILVLILASQTLAGTEGPSAISVHDELNPERFELALESGYLFGFINSPHSYEIGAEFGACWTGTIGCAVTINFI